MKQSNNQNGYALLIVLLMIVLFLGLSATFMAGSLNNATQEQTVDTTNQSVASAEMGVNYFTSDFQRELEIIKTDISETTQLAINDLIACIKPPKEPRCDSDLKIQAIEDKIDSDMRALYIQKIHTKISNLNTLAGNQIVPYSDGHVSYAIKSAAGTKLNEAGQNVDDASVSDKKTRTVRVDLGIAGTSKAATKNLNVSFKVEVPESFLDEEEPFIVETKKPSTKEDVKYADVFDTAPPAKMCMDMLAEVKAGTALTPLYKCKLAENQKLDAFVASIISSNLNPADFKVYTDSFSKNVCTTTCNSLDFKGISLVVAPSDTDAFNNMNNLVNANLMVNGKLTVGSNLINLGKNGTKQTIIVKELNVDNNIQNMYYTNFLVLGKEVPEGQPEAVSELKWGQNFEVDNHSRLCIDIDRILPSDLTRLAKEVKFTNSGSLIYFTKDPNKKFVLLSANGINSTEDAERTKLYVHKMSPPTESYTTFLAACGVTISKTITESTEVAVPSVLKPSFEFDVEY
ncbi:hypothetical protein [Planomicrobium sp. CPCC 101110]|uniref:hypothetical protein n=1 Tax=Planomicrobium sp. CPCC 101110 TaxID=2599619 RepID=UPI0011B6DD7F|nr:hypothetical protein [Planomicrobium sp. CPCC 101110]TWT26275.1 hypothetical protein FQV30_10860 [Planomicrobium sp. CPCC 101110]